MTNELGYWVVIAIWIVVIVTTVFIELETGELTSIWFSIGAFPALILAIYDFNILTQFLVFVSVSFVTLFTLKKQFKRNTPLEKTNLDKYEGQVCTVTKTIFKEVEGEVKIEGNIWRAISQTGEEFQVNDKVVVVKILGNKLIIKKREEN